MATVAELKAQLAIKEQELVPLLAAAEAADVKLNQAQAALDAFLSRPGNLDLGDVIDAKKAADANPNNAALQQQYLAIQTQWNTQLAEYQPLLAARDAAFDARTNARKPYIAKQDEAAAIDIEIAKIDPSQASPAAVAYLKQNGELPVTTSSDPAGPPATEPETPTEQTVIDALDDETAAMAEPIAVEEPTSQDVIDAEEDPFLQSEMIAAQSEQEPPTEQAVIDALDDETAAMADAGMADTPEYIPPTDDDVRSATNVQGLQNVNSPNAQASAQDEVNFNLQKDWRVRLSLAEGAYYLYENKDSPGILAPLADTKGVIFPYTPQIQVQYVANYDPTTVTHSNYKIYQYNSSSIDNITITGDFTAQDTFEANYLLAVIHFFRSVTKMFYAQDKDPKAGTPPPLCYLHGLGAFQFDTHPLVITSFNYNLPNNVDYIRASINEQTKIGPDSGGTTGTASQTRLKGISPGGRPIPVQFAAGPKNQKEPTYVPTKIQLQISAAPMISRNQISNDFSVKQYATGELLRGSKRQKPGVW